MKTLLVAALLAGFASIAFAQNTPYGRPQTETGLTTPIQQQIGVSLSSYTYREPGDLSISIHGPKLGVSYTNTRALGARGHWFAQADARSAFGLATYDGWCSPFLIQPEASSPNGYVLGVGAASACSETGDQDWHVEGRGLVGRDLVGESWGIAPFSGVGVRHLSNGTTGTAGYRTDDYLYVPIGLTARTHAGSRGAMSVTVEYDRLIRGWQKTRDSALGSGDLPATLIAPAFSIDGFTDIAFTQSSGWAVRTSMKYQPAGHWSLEPYYLRWSVDASPISDETATFTVNRITVREQLGAYEPFNVTNEFGIRLGIGF